MTNDLDKQIIQQLQNDFPIAENPYNIIADRLGIDADELIARVRQMSDSGLIRRLGFSINSRKLGYSSTLAAMSVAADQVPKATDVLNGFPEVTHNYQRSGNFNIWFTLIAPDQSRIEHILADIRSKMSLDKDSLINLPTKRLFKLDARFKLKNQVNSQL